MDHNKKYHFSKKTFQKKNLFKIKKKIMAKQKINKTLIRTFKGLKNLKQK